MEPAMLWGASVAGPTESRRSARRGKAHRASLAGRGEDAAARFQRPSPPYRPVDILAVADAACRDPTCLRFATGRAFINDPANGLNTMTLPFTGGLELSMHNANSQGAGQMRQPGK